MTSAVAPALVAALGTLLVLRAVLPVGYLVGVGMLIESVARAVVPGGGPAEAARMAWILGTLGAVVVAQELAESAQGLLAGALQRRLTRATSAAVLAGALRPVGIAHLEDPRVADRIALAQGLGAGSLPPGAAVPALAQLGAARLSGLAAVATLAHFCWWAPIPLAGAWLFTGGWLDREVRGVLRGLESDTPSLRRAAYFRELALAPTGAKELRVFGLAEWTAHRFAAAWQDGMREVLAYRQPTGALVARVGLLAAAHLVALTALALGATRGSLGVTGLAVAVQAVFGIAALGYAGDAQWTLSNAGAALPHVLAVRELATADPMPRESLSAAGLPAHGIRFDRVTFGYDGAQRPVLDNLDLWIPAGRSLAVVGANGAGKTTLLTLLARLHDPDGGQLTVDGHDLRSLDPADWRRRLAVVFQDACRFEATLRDNVRFGAIHAPAHDAEVAEVLRRAGAERLLDTLPRGLDTVLSRQHEGGAELSGGEWQKVALARALFAVHHGARVLILDEPTAHLDVRAESRLYQRFMELTRGTTTILTSHRFSTVRLADRICVVRGGRVVESGAHSDLVAAGGEYARMFGLQAARFGTTSRA